MKRTVFAGAILILSLATGAGRGQPAPSITADNSIVASIPFELVAGHIVLQVRVDNSRPLSFFFDTGDRVGLIDTARARELALKFTREIMIGGAGSQLLTGSPVEGSNWTLTGLEGFSQPIRLAIPLGDLARAFGHDFDGIIGGEFISQYVIEVDYKGRILKLHDKSRFKYSGPGEIIPIELNHGGFPVIEGMMPIGSEPLRGKFVLDLGSGDTVILHSPFVVGHHLLDGKFETIKAIGRGGAGGRSNGRAGRVAELKIGKFKISNPTAMFSEDKTGTLADAELAGNIGQRIAGKFKTFLDYSNERIILEATDAFSKPLDRASSALSAENKNFKTFRVTEVLEASPASEAGLQKDDLITKVNDKQSADLTLSRLKEMFEQSATYKVTVRRGARILKVTLTTRKLV